MSYSSAEGSQFAPSPPSGSYINYPTAQGLCDFSSGLNATQINCNDVHINDHIQFANNSIQSSAYIPSTGSAVTNAVLTTTSQASSVLSTVYTVTPSVAGLYLIIAGIELRAAGSIVILNSTLYVKNGTSTIDEIVNPDGGSTTEYNIQYLLSVSSSYFDGVTPLTVNVQAVTSNSSAYSSMGSPNSKVILVKLA